jgi:hypothetical protein
MHSLPHIADQQVTFQVVVTPSSRPVNVKEKALVASLLLSQETTNNITNKTQINVFFITSSSLII